MSECPTCIGLMCPDHQRWPEFLDRLAEALAGPAAWATGDVDVIVKAADLGCQHGTYNASRAILATMGMDVEASLDYFDRHGCCCSCDCEVLTKLEADVEAGRCGCEAD